MTAADAVATPPPSEAINAAERLERVEALLADERVQHQRQLVELHAEINQLKETINALRDSMELARIGEQERTQKALAQSTAEVLQLKGSINALRDQLDHAQQRIKADA